MNHHRNLGMFCVGFNWLVGLSRSDINWSTIWSAYILQCYEHSNLATFQFWQFDLGQPPTTNNTQTKYIQLAKRLWVRVQVQPIFLFECLIWE